MPVPSTSNLSKRRLMASSCSCDTPAGTRPQKYKHRAVKSLLRKNNIASQQESRLHRDAPFVMADRVQASYNFRLTDSLVHSHCASNSWESYIEATKEREWIRRVSIDACHTPSLSIYHMRGIRKQEAESHSPWEGQTVPNAQC